MEQMNIVVVGHVDHGKSTVIGRMLADTGSLPKGKLEQIKKRCERESKTFEYAFLLDALKDEQSQGVTIDSARCFFKSDKRDYAIIDAPGHIGFLKNMISGAARAEAAVLVIDAHEGVQENSRRHGYLLSLLGIRQLIVCVNKMDLVDYKKEAYQGIVDEYTRFLRSIDTVPMAFLPVSALEGDNIARSSEKMSWYKGHTLLLALDSFKKEADPSDKPFRMPVQDVYKFTKGDSRRIVAGRVESGKISEGDKVIFLPSYKRTKVKSIEHFNVPRRTSASAGTSTGVTMEEQLYVTRGEVMCKLDDKLPAVSSILEANIFWMGKEPLKESKNYFLKIGTTKMPVRIEKIHWVLNASNLKKEEKDNVEKHEVGACKLSCTRSIAFDTFQDLSVTGRFVIVDGYDICGGGIVTHSLEDNQADIRRSVYKREERWEKGFVSSKDRRERYSQVPSLVLITGKSGVDKKTPAKMLEKTIFEKGHSAYFLGIGNILRGLDSDISKRERREHIRRLAEVAHILMDAGMIVIATASDLTDREIKDMSEISDHQLFIVNMGEQILDSRLIDLHQEETDIDELMELLRFKGVFDV